MQVFNYEPTYTNFATVKKVPATVLDKFQVNDDENVKNWLTPKVYEMAQQIKQQKAQAIKVREMMAKTNGVVFK